MSDYEDEFEGNEDEANEKKNPLRPVLKQKEKELSSALSELKKYREKERASTVADLIKQAGGDPRYAKFYTSEDSSEEAVKAWIQSESELLGVQPAEPENQAAAAQVSAVANAVNSAPPQAKLGSTPDLIALMRSAKTREELDAAINAAFAAGRPTA